MLQIFDFWVGGPTLPEARLSANHRELLHKTRDGLLPKRWTSTYQIPFSLPRLNRISNPFLRQHETPRLPPIIQLIDSYHSRKKIVNHAFQSFINLLWSSSFHYITKNLTFHWCVKGSWKWGILSYRFAIACEPSCVLGFKSSWRCHDCPTRGYCWSRDLSLESVGNFEWSSRCRRSRESCPFSALLGWR